MARSRSIGRGDGIEDGGRAKEHVSKVGGYLCRLLPIMVLNLFLKHLDVL